MIEYKDIENYLGTPVKTMNGHSYWMCPYCRDTGKDNLVYTQKNGLLTCFANDEHSKDVLREINKSDAVLQDYKPREQKPIMKTKSSLTMDYIIECNLALLECEKSKTFLKNQRGLYGETLTLGIGIDKIKKVWIFPCFDLQTGELFGAEYRTSYMIFTKDKRDKGNEGLSKAPGTSARLCTINNIKKADTLIIVEGFIDAFTLWQMLNEQERMKTKICTPSNGVGTIKNLLDTIPINKYSQIIFFLDSDEAGEQAREDIKKLFKANYSFKKISCSCCKDVSQSYLTHYRKAV